MSEFIRRSNLLLPFTERGFPLSDGYLPDNEGRDGDLVRDPWLHFPDAVTLDLADGVLEGRKEEARASLKDAIGPAGKGSAEVFVRTDWKSLQADLEASIWPGLAGVMLSGVQAVADATRADEMMTKLEQARGIRAGSLEIIVLLESALAVWNIREIVTATRRVMQAGLGETALCADLGIMPSVDYDPLVYMRGRLVIEAIAAGVQPVGMGYPLGAIPQFAPRDELFRLAEVGKNLGCKGVICAHPSWVEPVNSAYTPAPDLVEYNRQVREVFAQAVAAGTAAVPFAGRMIDVPVDEWAKVVLSKAEACRTRDEEKKRAWDSSG